MGIPYSISNPVLYLNQDILKAAGLDENGPKTWEEVQTFSKIIKEKLESMACIFKNLLIIGHNKQF